MHGIHEVFMVWAASYDNGGEEMRSRRQHERWLAALPCPLLRLEEPVEVAEQMARLAQRLAVDAGSRSASPASGRGVPIRGDIG